MEMANPALQNVPLRCPCSEGEEGVRTPCNLNQTPSYLLEMLSASIVLGR